MRTHCRNGHYLTEENTYRAKNGDHVCRTCLKKCSKRYQQRSYERQLHFSIEDSEVYRER